MLGYTIETIMKAGLLEVMSDEEQSRSKILKNSHDIVKIFKECKKYNLFKSIEVTNDFLEHVNNNFQRYPCQLQAVLETATSKNNVLSNSIDHINYYDDLIVKLDKYLLEKYNKPILSILYFALFTLETRYAQDILLRNAFGLNEFDLYKSYIYKNLPDREDIKELLQQNLAKGVSYYWDPSNTNEYKRVAHAILEKYSANSFSFQKWGKEVAF